MGNQARRRGTGAAGVPCGTAGWVILCQPDQIVATISWIWDFAVATSSEVLGALNSPILDHGVLTPGQQASRPIQVRPGSGYDRPADQDHLRRDAWQRRARHCSDYKCSPTRTYRSHRWMSGLKMENTLIPSYSLEMIDTILAYLISLGIIVAGAGWIAVGMHSRLGLAVGVVSVFVGVGSLLNEAQHGTN